MAGDAFHKNGITALLFAAAKKWSDWRDRVAREKDRKRYERLNRNAKN